MHCVYELLLIPVLEVDGYDGPWYFREDGERILLEVPDLLAHHVRRRKRLKREVSCKMSRADWKSKVRQCLGLCTADFWSLLAYESAEQKPKHCLT